MLGLLVVRIFEYQVMGFKIVVSHAFAEHKTTLVFYSFIFTNFTYWLLGLLYFRIHTPHNPTSSTPPTQPQPQKLKIEGCPELAPLPAGLGGHTALEAAIAAAQGQRLPLQQKADIAPFILRSLKGMSVLKPFWRWFNIFSECFRLSRSGVEHIFWVVSSVRRLSDTDVIVFFNLQKHI